MSGDRDLDRSAADYWMGLAKAGTQKPPRRLRRRKATGGTMPDESEPESTDSTDPLVLIVQALRENADAIQAMESELRAVRLAMADLERKMAQRADTNSADIRSVMSAVQNLAVSQAALERLKSDRYMWVLGGVMIGAVLASIALNDIPILWQRLFG